MLKTQRNAWKEKLPTLGRSQHDVLLKITESDEGMTLFELVNALQWPINRVSGRVTELSRKKMIMPQGTRKNPQTGKAGVVWVAITDKKSKQLQIAV